MEAFRQIKWDEVHDGQEVYIAGTHLGVFKAYGPHKVFSKEKRELINRSGVKFLQYDECLLISGVINE